MEMELQGAAREPLLSEVAAELESAQANYKIAKEELDYHRTVERKAFSALTSARQNFNFAIAAMKPKRPRKEPTPELVNAVRGIDRDGQ